MKNYLLIFAIYTFYILYFIFLISFDHMLNKGLTEFESIKYAIQ